MKDEIFALRANEADLIQEEKLKDLVTAEGIAFETKELTRHQGGPITRLGGYLMNRIIKKNNLQV